LADVKFLSNLNQDLSETMVEETKVELPKPEGICKFCKKPIYIGLDKHELICQFK